MRFSRQFYRRDACTLAKDLLGRRLVRLEAGQRISGLIVEVEAYLGIPDLAAHTAGGRRTARNESMYMDGGHLYVYFTYGMHYCMNIVAGMVDDPVAVLIRAIEPTEGLTLMKTRRVKAKRDIDLCSGPAKTCQALGIDRQFNGIDLTAEDSPVFIEPAGDNRTQIASQIVSGPRIGVGYAKEWADRPLRFYLRDNPYTSKP